MRSKITMYNRKDKSNLLEMNKLAEMKKLETIIEENEAAIEHNDASR